MGRKDCVVGLNHGGRDTRGRVNSELELGLLAVVGGETLEKERAETRTGTTSEGMEDQKSLERRAVVCCISALSR